MPQPIPPDAPPAQHETWHPPMAPLPAQGQWCRPVVCAQKAVSAQVPAQKAIVAQRFECRQCDVTWYDTDSTCWNCHQPATPAATGRTGHGPPGVAGLPMGLRA
ncbi:hypothetical protein OG331_47370 [Streptomyces sp. NBC_01017]|uniref:hypothetical protein n=1 Tax=Streptomyces sp. NBC_01017 TaxID=2903721 RepID=UPI00386BC9DA|nr:hypothetical protein OG331_04620 [Streptomyces sp. NBC_01017]WSV34698.1 hypothetical protein OG331_47370 [Streptomyces sp. NBC_01017]